MQVHLTSLLVLPVRQTPEILPHTCTCEWTSRQPGGLQWQWLYLGPAGMGSLGQQSSGNSAPGSEERNLHHKSFSSPKSPLGYTHCKIYDLFVSFSGLWVLMNRNKVHCRHHESTANILNGCSWSRPQSPPFKGAHFQCSIYSVKQTVEGSDCYSQRLMNLFSTSK